MNQLEEAVPSLQPSGPSGRSDVNEGFSVLVLAYNQEGLIEEALNSIAAQTVLPDEIVVADDHSQDATVEVIRGWMARNQHLKVSLVLSEQNRGITGNLSRGMKAVRTSYVAVAAGDDVMMPERVETLQRAFQAGSPKLVYIASGCLEFDAASNQTRVVSSTDTVRGAGIGAFIGGNCQGYMGATAAWHRDLFDSFGDIPEEVWFEDRVLPFRAALIGETCCIPRPLVKYRIHGANVIQDFRRGEKSGQARIQKRMAAVYRENLRCLRLARGSNAPSSAWKLCISLLLRRKALLSSMHCRIIVGGTWLAAAAVLTVLVLLGDPRSSIRLRSMP